ncbi:MAG: aminotransferase class I/II-fold pyridoxal phosphate-dependent enzyme [Bacilli bacterium]
MRFTNEIKDSPTLMLAEKARQIEKEGKHLLSLAIGEPDFATPPYIIEATKKALDAGFTKYSTPQGLLELRTLIAKEYKGYKPDEVIIFPGAKAAIFAGLGAILEPGDEVIVLAPYYVSYPAIIKLAEPEAVIKYVSLNDDFTLPIEKIKETITPKTKCLIVNYPHNPTGQMLSFKETMDLVNLVYKHKIFLLSDEIYEKLNYSGKAFHSFGSFPLIKDQLILINGFSKAYAMTGFRLGYALASKEIIYKMNLINQNTNTNTATFIQKGAVAALTNKPMFLLTYNNELKARAVYLHEEINKLPLFSGLLPDGAFYYFMNIEKTNLDSITFANKLLEEYHLVVTPGIAFGEDYDHYVRLSLAVPLETLKEAINILKEYK